jgi:hypothetical protein
MTTTTDAQLAQEFAELDAAIHASGRFDAEVLAAAIEAALGGEA